MDLNVGLKAIGAGLAIGISCLGSAIGEGNAASSAIGATAEDEDNFAKSLILTVLPETQAIFGLVIAIWILTQL